MLKTSAAIDVRSSMWCPWKNVLEKDAFGFLVFIELVQRAGALITDGITTTIMIQKFPTQSFSRVSPDYPWSVCCHDRVTVLEFTSGNAQYVLLVAACCFDLHPCCCTCIIRGLFLLIAVHSILYRYTIVYLSIHWLMDICIVSSLGLLLKLL